jgi:hypothetical protein
MKGQGRGKERLENTIVSTQLTHVPTGRNRG